MKIENSIGPASFAKNTKTQKIYLVRCCKVYNEDGTDFDIIHQYLKNDNWVTNNKICSPLYTFFVPEAIKLIRQSTIKF